MIVKKIPNKDLKKAKIIYQECFQKKKEYTKEISYHSLKDNLLGLYDKNKLIGIAQINFFNNIFENKKVAYINSLGINPNDQNKGYGNYFMNEIIKYCQKKKVSQIQLTSNKNRIVAHKLYQKYNFQEINTSFLIKNINKNK